MTRSSAPAFEITIRPIESGWTWMVVLFGQTVLRRGRAGNVCVAALDAADALEHEQLSRPSLRDEHLAPAPSTVSVLDANGELRTEGLEEP